ncbi:hypothetical protein ABZ746_17140 [Streptomyces sp. NPDC020096]
MAFVGFNPAKVRKLADDLNSAAPGAQTLHSNIAGILHDAQAALDAGKKATNSPQLEQIQRTGSIGIGGLTPVAPIGIAAPVGLPGQLASELPSIATEMKSRCDKAEAARKAHGFGQGISPLDAFNGVTPQPPRKPKKKGWFQKYISDPVKHGIDDVGGFMASVFNWRSMLDAGSMALGTFLMAAGAGTEIGGTLLDVTGVGAIIGVPANIAGVAVFGTGAALALSGLGDFITQMSDGDFNNAWSRDGKQGSTGGGSELPPVSEEDQAAFTKSQEDLASLSKNKQVAQVSKGIEKDGQKYKPERALLKGTKHGIDWTEGPQRAKLSNNPQGRFGSPADVNFATEKASELGPGKEGFFKLPEGNDCIEYMPDGSIRKPNALFVKVRPDGTVHAYPTTR